MNSDDFSAFWIEVTQAAESFMTDVEQAVKDVTESFVADVEQVFIDLVSTWIADIESVYELLDLEEQDFSNYFDEVTYDPDSTSRVYRGVHMSPLGFGAMITYAEVVSRGEIGDTTCRFNARSAQIRCAVNPDGPCEGCPHYEKQLEGEW